MALGFLAKRCSSWFNKISSMDDVGLLFSSSEWKTFQEPDPSATTKLKIPKNEEVGRVDLKKQNTDDSAVLIDTKKKHAEKMRKLKQKMEQLRTEQKELELNLTKFNTFVKEKQLKVERGIATEREEKELREKMTHDIAEKEVVLIELTDAREFLEEAVKKRKMFHDFLHTVVDSEASRSRYKDIGELMKRCETLVATRDNLLSTRDKIRSAIQKEEDGLANFKEEQNARILEFSAKLNEFQEKYYAAEAKRLEKQRVLDAQAKEDVNKQLLIANIRLSILTLWQYVSSKKISLPGDRKAVEEHNRLKPPGLNDQLAAIQAHIEDLKVVIQRVNAATDLDGYNAPLVSEPSELRIDY